MKNLSLERDGAAGNKGRTEFGDAMGEGEPDFGGKELFDVRTADIVCLLDLDHSENLWKSGQMRAPRNSYILKKRTWIERKRARCLAAMSWYKLFTASARLRSRNSLYMLCVPDRES